MLAHKLEDLSHFFLLLETRGRLFAAFVAGVVAVLGQAPFHFYPAFVVSFVVLFWLIDGLFALRSTAVRPRVFLTGWMFGFGYSLAGFYWIIFPFFIDFGGWGWLGIPAWIAFSAGLGLFTGVAAKLAHGLWSQSVLRVFPFVLAFALLDMAKGSVFTGLPWNAYGYTLALDDVSLQSFSLFGVWGAGVVALLLPASLSVLVDPRPLWQKLAPLGLSLVILGGLYGFGHWRLSTAGDTTFHDYRVGLVQTQIRQGDKWRRNLRDAHFETLLELSLLDSDNYNGILGDLRAGAQTQYNALGLPIQNATRPPQQEPSPSNQSQEGSKLIANMSILPDLIIWPETALPFLISEDPEKLAALALLLNNQTKLMTGAIRVEQERDDLLAYNALYLLSKTAEVEATYDKVHLVPFGEYLPLQIVLKALNLPVINQIKHGFHAGTERRNLNLSDTLNTLPLICYEAIFPSYARATPRPDFLTNITNDAWFGRSSGPYQHAHQVRVRSVETGLPLVRVANKGVSFMSNAYGQMIAHIPSSHAKMVVTQVPTALPSTLYATYGNSIFILIMAFFMIISTFNRIFLRK